VTGQMMSFSSHSFACYSSQKKLAELVPFIPVFLSKNGQQKRILEHKAKERREKEMKITGKIIFLSFPPP